MSSNKINTLSELKAERLRLKQQADYASTAIISKAQNTMASGQNSLLKQMALPTVLTSIAAFGVNHFMSNQNTQNGLAPFNRPAVKQTDSLIDHAVSSFQDFNARPSAKWMAFLPIAIRLFNEWRAGNLDMATIKEQIPNVLFSSSTTNTINRQAA